MKQELKDAIAKELQKRQELKNEIAKELQAVGFHHANNPDTLDGELVNKVYDGIAMVRASGKENFENYTILKPIVSNIVYKLAK